MYPVAELEWYETGWPERPAALSPGARLAALLAGVETNLDAEHPDPADRLPQSADRRATERDGTSGFTTDRASPCPHAGRARGSG